MRWGLVPKGGDLLSSLPSASSPFQTGGEGGEEGYAEYAGRRRIEGFSPAPSLGYAQYFTVLFHCKSQTVVSVREAQIECLALRIV